MGSLLRSWPWLNGLLALITLACGYYGPEIFAGTDWSDGRKTLAGIGTGLGCAVIVLCSRAIRALLIHTNEETDSGSEEPE